MGLSVGDNVETVGDTVGEVDGDSVGLRVGELVGANVGAKVGDIDGAMVAEASVCFPALRIRR